jgi:hypothetical protein
MTVTLLFWVVTPCRLVSRQDGSVKHTVSNFRIEVETERVCSSETLISTYQSTRRYNLEEGEHNNPYHRKNLKAHTF